MIVAKAAVVTNDGIVLRPHERLPTQLVVEWCQREKRPLPSYRPKPGVPNGHRHILWLADKKDSKKDLSYLPAETDFESTKVAKDFAALLALFDLQRTLPLENKLPEPFCTTWKSMVASYKEKERAEKTAARGGRGGGGKTVPATVPTATSSAKVSIESDVQAHVLDDADTGSNAIRVSLDDATADWLCCSCNSQNLATLKSGARRTKCFKCGTERTDECELVVSSATAVAPPVSVTSFILAKEEAPVVPSFGFTEPKIDVSDRNAGLGDRIFKMGNARPPPSVRL